MGPEGAFLFGESFTEADWLEAVNLFSPSQFSVGRQDAIATVTAYVENFAKLKSCVHWLRGYAWVDENLNLRRVRPARHPIWSNLVCTEIVNVVGITFTEKQEIITEAMDLPFARYDKIRLTASFSAPPYLIYEDGEVETEDERWTTFVPKPYTDFYDLPGGEVLFVADNPLKAWNNQPVPTRVVIRSRKNLYTLKWFAVPASFVRDEDGHMPHIDNAIGKVNSAAYAGKDIGCWLLDDVDIEIYNDPIVGDILDSPGRMVNITYYMKLWEPTAGHATDAARGWQLELAVDGKGYPTTRQEGVQPKVETVNFATLFTHHSL